MSDEQDEESKTEEGSDRRRQQAFDEGQVPLGKDAVQWAALLAALMAMTGVAGTLYKSMMTAFRTMAANLNDTPFQMLPGLLVPMGLSALIIIAAPALASIIATMAQTQGQIWGNLAMPDPSRLWQMSRLKRLVSMEVVVDTLMSAAKVAAVVAAAWSALRDSFVSLSALLTANTGVQLERLFENLSKAGVRIVAVLAILAGAELALTRFRFSKKMRMTKDELRREYKQEEGDPLIRSRRKRKHRELTQHNARAETVKADAVIVNPTHIAIAIRYRKEDGGAPRVIAKGKGAIAETIRDTARENGIPIVQDIPLARLLYKRVKVGKQVPSETYKAVAAILAFVYRLTGGQSGQAGAR